MTSANTAEAPAEPREGLPTKAAVGGTLSDDQDASTPTDWKCSRRREGARRRASGRPGPAYADAADRLSASGFRFSGWSSRKRSAWSCSQSGAALFGSAERALGRGVAAVLGAGEGYLVLVEL
jgi:hypothetical protein